MGSWKFRRQPSLPASHPITSATETLQCTGHSTAALTRTHSPWVVWLLQVSGHQYINRTFFFFLSGWSFSGCMEKNHHTSSLLSKILFLKLSKSKYGTIPTVADCQILIALLPSSQKLIHCIRVFSSAVLGASPCFAALQWYLVSCQIPGGKECNQMVCYLIGTNCERLETRHRKGCSLITISKMLFK